MKTLRVIFLYITMHVSFILSLYMFKPETSEQLTLSMYFSLGVLVVPVWFASLLFLNMTKKKDNLL